MDTSLILFNGSSTLGALFAKCLDPLNVLGFFRVFANSFCCNVTLAGLVLSFYAFETPLMLIWTDNIPYIFRIMNTVLTPRRRTPFNDLRVLTIRLRNNLHVFFTSFLAHHRLQEGQRQRQITILKRTF